MRIEYRYVRVASPQIEITPEQAQVLRAIAKREEERMQQEMLRALYPQGRAAYVRDVMAEMERADD